jgi:hypothetical protein
MSIKYNYSEYTNKLIRIERDFIQRNIAVFTRVVLALLTQGCYWILDMVERVKQNISQNGKPKITFMYNVKI